MKVSIDGHPVFSSGSIITQASSSVLLMPFDDDPDFILDFRLSLSSDGTRKLDIKQGDGLKTTVFEFTIPFKPLDAFGNIKPISFGISDDGLREYFISFAAFLFGSKENYTLEIKYTIQDRARN